ncbi:MAG: PAS domain S-box protein [Armatimonadota bacterium]
MSKNLPPNPLPAPELLAAIIESSDDGIISKDLDGIITSWNHGAERIYGYTPEEMIGQPILKLIPPERYDEEPEILRRIGQGQRVDHFETVRVRKDGTRIDVSVTISPVRDATGTIVGASKIARDITEQRRLQSQLQEHQEELEALNEELITTNEELIAANRELAHQGDQLREANVALQEETQTVETINRVGQSLSAELDLQKLVQLATDAGTQLTGAQFGAFFYNVVNESGESYTLYTISGVPREAFSRFPMPRNTKIFSPTFSGEGVVRLDDVTQDPRYGQNPPYHGMPEGHLPVRSYLAVPVVSRSGEVLGGLFFGHEKPGVFTARAEQVVVGIAAQAAVAIDNARLYQEAQRELQQRQEAEEALRRSEERLRAIVQNSPSVIFLKDLQGRYLLMNHHGHTLLADQPLESVLGRTDEELFPGEIAERVREHDARVLEAGEALRFEETSEDGRHYITQKFVLRDPEGRPSALGGISTDITTLQQLQAELQQRAAELAHADRQKDEFLAMLAHELRNPLAPILNAVQVLRARGGPDPLVQRQGAVIDRQARHMSRLLDDLLDVSRITQGKIELRKQPASLSAAVEHALEIAQPSIQARRHELNVSLPEDPLFVSADPTRLHQVIGNLLHNAAKYTPAGGRIEVTVTPRDGEAELTVRDNGVGISPEFLPRLFDLFSQADRSLARTESGLGIGLTMVKRLIELHGGTVAARSDGPGHGSEFRIRLPLLTRSAEPDSHNTAPHPAEAGAPGRRILIVDDNEDAAETLADLATLWGYGVRTAHSGAAAIRLAGEYHPEVVLLDISMPGMSGYEVAERLRQEPELQTSLLIALTGYGQPEDRRRTREAGFHHHLTKPVDPDLLRRILETT